MLQCLDHEAGRTEYIRPVAAAHRMSNPPLVHMATPTQGALFALRHGPCSDIVAKSRKAAKGRLIRGCNVGETPHR